MVIGPARRGTFVAAAVALAACTSSPAAADARLCDEVAAVTADLVARGGPEPSTYRTRDHEELVGASHLLVAAEGGLDSEPDPDLADAVRTAGREGIGGTTDDYAGALAASFEACDAAGAEMDDEHLAELTAVADDAPAGR